MRNKDLEPWLYWHRRQRSQCGRSRVPGAKAVDIDRLSRFDPRPPLSRKRHAASAIDGLGILDRLGHQLRLRVQTFHRTGLGVAIMQYRAVLFHFLCDNSIV